MRESFSEYKKTLEQNLINISYLYSGDIISSTNSNYTEIKENPLTSPSFIINSIVNIYNQSFDQMINKSKEIIIAEESLKLKGINIIDKIFELGIKPIYIFSSEKGKNLFGQFLKGKSTSAFPQYFYYLDKFANIEVFYSPLINEESDETVLYISDAPIQSLVYSVQNMEYSIDPTINGFTPNIPDRWKHTISYKFYDCKFNSYKISIRNVSRLRNDKINKILNDN